MARRLALLALLACAAVANCLPLRSENTSDSNSYDLALWDDYDESLEKSLPTYITIRPKNKVIIRNKVPKLNVTKKNDKSGEKVRLIKTTINISSQTNFIVTNPPLIVEETSSVVPRHPIATFTNVSDHQLVVNVVSQTSRPSSKKTPKPRLTSTRRPPTTARPKITTTKKRRFRTTTTRRYQTTTTRRYQTTTTRRPTTRPTLKTTKKPCKRKHSNRLSKYNPEKNIKKSPKNEEKSGWFVGLFSKLYSWFAESKSTWFYSGWFNDISLVTTTTQNPLPDSTDNWYQNALDPEDVENTIVRKEKSKKSLKKTYKGYQLVRTYPDVQWKVASLLELQEDAEGSGLMWWTYPSLNGSTDLLVPPDLITDVKEHLKSYKIEFEIIIFDLQKSIMYENPKLSKKQRLELEHLHGHPMTWRRYHRYADILRYLEYLQHSYADIVELVPLGLSSEGLPLVAVKVSLPTNDTQKDNPVKSPRKKWRLRSHMKPAVWLDGGAHAREWIAPAVTTWMLHNLIEGADREILEVADFYIMPVVNPDGYEHTHTHDRLWRKTRSRSPDHSNDYFVGWFPWNWGRTECVGVDVDRNWDYHWGEKDSSNDPCADNYAGPHPFSEPETRAVSEFLTDHRGQIKVYISLHAYTQAWLLPSSQSSTGFADDGTLLEMGKLATAALADMYGTKYKVGTAEQIHQPASGMSHDWAKARAGIKYAYHVDLRDSFGPYGFLLPGSQIVSTARETWQAVRAVVDNLTPEP